MASLHAVAAAVLACILPALEPARQRACTELCVDSLCARLTGTDQIPVLARISTHLFMGTVVSARTLPEQDCVADVTFRVTQRWKGAEGTLITVRTGAPCGAPFPFSIARDYVVSARGAGSTEKPAHLNDCQFTPLDGAFALQYARALDRWRSEGAHEAALK